MIVTANHVDDSTYKDYIKIYYDVSNDMAIYSNTLTPGNYGEVILGNIDTNGFRYLGDYEEVPIWIKIPNEVRVGEKLDVLEKKVIVESVHDSYFTVKFLDATPYQGMSGSNVTKNGELVGVVSSYMATGSIKVRRVEYD